MPRLISNIIKWLLINNHPEAVIGDAEEEYFERRKLSGRFSAGLWLCGQILIFIPLHYANSFYRGLAMFKNYFKIGYRNLIKEKIISAVSIIGLGIGMAAAILLMIFIHHELSYDKYLPDADRIYRMYTEKKNSEGNNNGYGITMGAFANSLREMPEVEAATKMYDLRRGILKDENKNIHSLSVFTADSGFFNVLNYDFAKGSIHRCLENPSAMVVTEKTALKVWGTTDVLGKQLEYKKGFLDDYVYVVVAVIKDLPVNSHLQFDLLVSHYSQPYIDKFGGDEFLTYFKLKPEIKAADVLPLIKERLQIHLKPRKEKLNYKGDPGIIGFTDMHLKASALFKDSSAKGSETFLYILSAVALSVLLISILNFINLLTAKFQNRTNEIGIRKVVGAEKNAIFIQFAAEASIIALFASVISLAVVYLTLEDFGNLVMRPLDIYLSKFHYLFLGALLLAVSVGIISSLIPAMKISRLNCVNILRNQTGSGKASRALPATVVFQFSIVIILMICISVIYKQINFMKNQSLGFDKEQIVYFDFSDYAKYPVIRERLKQNPNIISVGASQTIPGSGKSGQLGVIRGLPGKEKIGLNENRVQQGYIETYGMKIIAGRSFDEKFSTDRESVVVNETLVKSMGLTAEEAIGRELEYLIKPLKIIGVIKDFHFRSLHNPIQPLVLSNYTYMIFKISAKIKSTNVQNTLDFINDLMREYDPEFVFDYAFVDEYFDKLYYNEERNNELLVYSASLAVALSAMGLFAVTLFAVVRRTKEIGIRKVLGGSVAGINYLLIRDYLIWVLLANLLAWPVAYWAMDKWLNNFAYRMELHPGFFISAGLAALGIAMFTVIYITTRAALQNPVKNIRYE